MNQTQTEYQKIIVDEPRPMVRRITLNRPEKRNALSNELRTELFAALEAAFEEADADTDTDVMIAESDAVQADIERLTLVILMPVNFAAITGQAAARFRGNVAAVFNLCFGTTAVLC